MQAQIDQLVRAAAKDEAKGDAQYAQGAAGGDVADMDDCACEAELEESIWISALLIGTRPVGNAASAYLLLLLLLTMGIQVAFLYILSLPQSGLIDKMEPDTVLELRSWRRTIAHSLSYFNKLKQQSLAKRVCTSDAGLELSSNQASLYDDLSGYLGEDNGFLESGHVLCILATTAWILTMLKELSSVWGIMIAALAIPRGVRTVVTVDRGSGGATVESASRAQIVAFIAVQAGRAALGAALLFYGCRFLAFTKSVADLLLNAVALEFVISVDELVFEALAPVKVRKLVAAGTPIAVPWPSRWHGLDFGAAAKCAALLGVLAWFVFAELNPQIRLMVEARDALCAGDQDFVFAEDKLGTPTWAYPGFNRAEQDKLTKSWSHPKRNFPDGKSPDSAHYAQPPTRPASFTELVVDTLLQQSGRDFWTDPARCVCLGPLDNATGIPIPLRDGKPSCCFASEHRVVRVDTAYRSLEWWTRESLEGTTIAWNPECFDVLATEAQYVSTMRSVISDDTDATRCGGYCPPGRPFCNSTGQCSVPSCADFARHCHENSKLGIRVRQLCPQTCGCNDPRSSLALSEPSGGCSRFCTRSGTYRARRARLACTDVERNDSVWHAYLDNIVNVSTTWTATLRASFMLVEPSMREYGCDYFAFGSNRLPFDGSKGPLKGYPPYIWGINRCVAKGAWADIKPVSYFCPVACGCHAGDEHCPDQCPPRPDPPAEHCPWYQTVASNEYPANTACALGPAPDASPR